MDEAPEIFRPNFLTACPQRERVPRRHRGARQMALTPPAATAQNKIPVNKKIFLRCSDGRA
jgi:hypothetical protein